MSKKDTPSVESSMQEDYSLIKGHKHGDSDDETEEGICSKLITTKSTRLASMLSLILVYFFAEVLVGESDTFFYLFY